ncbi:hypothetical protein [Pseudorhodoferax sp. Leaf267]|uniref:hypothetical protein n=1 Tax=Pseudorhodoferax sp. Leaf267 TaxID=1736316 RepID=UPI0012E0D2BA|nr:hypothetical protein [Pseudorhodoferax sp. Leaf267]
MKRFKISDFAFLVIFVVSGLSLTLKLEQNLPTSWTMVEAIAPGVFLFSANLWRVLERFSPH